MKRVDNKNSLPPEQAIILASFIKQFLPSTGNKRSHSGNEIHFITTALNRLFRKNFGFHVTADQLLNAFENLGYEIFTKLKNVESKFYLSCTYVDISPATLRELRATTYGTQPIAKQPSLQFKHELQERINSFKNSIPKA